MNLDEDAVVEELVEREVRVTIDMNLGSGEYSVQFNNMTDPGENMDLGEILGTLHGVLVDIEKREGCEDSV